MIRLRWDVPTTNQDGSRLTDLAGFRVDRYTYPAGQYCPECKDRETVATITADRPSPATLNDGFFYLRLPHPGADRGVRYRVYPLAADGTSGPFVASRRLIGPAPAAPVGIKATPLDRGVNLLWSLPATVQDRGVLLGVNIYRGKSDSGLDPEPVNAQPVKGNNFDDFGLQNDRTYYYGLRTVIRWKSAIIESALSEVSAATPQAGL